MKSCAVVIELQGGRATGIVTAVMVALALTLPATSIAAEPAKTGSAVSPVVASAKVIKFAPNMTMTSLAGRPDTDLVELSNGRRVRVGDLRRHDDAAKKMRTAAPGGGAPPAFRIKPAATGTRVNNAADLAAALKRSDNETVQLPSGRLVTVGQIRSVQPQVEKQLGRKLASPPQRPNLAGTAIKVTAQTTKSDWKNILQKPDATVLEAPDGQRITVGELKKALAVSGKTGARGRVKAAPAPALK